MAQEQLSMPSINVERIVRANGVDLCLQTFGDPTDPAIFLLMGASASMVWWEDDFCERLAAGSRLLVRHDTRGTGRSIAYEPDAPAYTLRDLAGDAVGLLDALGLARAHLVGFSTGGAVAQLVALEHPERVASLTLISTSPGGPDLPAMSEQYLARIEAAVVPDWSDRAAVVNYVVELWRAGASGSRPFDEGATRELAGRDVDRSVSIASSMTNHFVDDGGVPRRARLGEIGAPTLVIHGAEDPVFPLDHGRALAKEIPGARLLTLEQTGHELPRATWGTVVPAILRHTSGG
jgi:pimeloyl-ACP methyl ester carboxylesterase